MNTLCKVSKHSPCSVDGIIGCSGYSNVESIICLIANDDNNFLNEGIVEKSIVFVDTKGTFENGKLNVFERKDCTPKLKISRVRLPDSKFIGRIIMCANQYE